MNNTTLGEADGVVLAENTWAGRALLGVRPTRRSDESRRTKHESVSGSMGSLVWIAVLPESEVQRQLGETGVQAGRVGVVPTALFTRPAWSRRSFTLVADYLPLGAWCGIIME
jgi:hypothetical protein